MDFLFKGLNDGGPDCPFNAQDIKRCPFLSNINKPTSFAFSTASFPLPGAKGPIFEDGPNFDTAFKLFHGKDGVVPLSGKSLFRNDNLETELAPPEFNPLAAKAATISLSSFGPGGPFSFDSFSKKWDKLKKKSEPSKNRKPSSQASKHEALGNEWLESGNCPIAKSYRAVSGVLPLVASALQPPPGMKFKCPPAVVAARAALARTALVKTLRPQPLPEKMLVIGVLGMAANVPLGIWREHTRKFSLSWFAAVHAAVPFIAMLRKSVVMPKTAMALTIAASVLGQVIGSRAERLRLKMKAEREVATPLSAGTCYDFGLPGNCGSGGITWDQLADRAGKSGSLSELADRAGKSRSLSAIGYSDRVDVIGGGHCGTSDGIVWDPLGDKGDKPASSSANVCY